MEDGIVIATLTKDRRIHHTPFHVYNQVDKR